MLITSISIFDSYKSPSLTDSVFSYRSLHFMVKKPIIVEAEKREYYQKKTAAVLCNVAHVCFGGV